MTEADVRQLIIAIIKPLVAKPQMISLEVSQGSHFLIFNLSVAPQDLGRVIGRNGRIANALRTLIHNTRLNGKQRVRLIIKNT
ncbi:KH domain-containing protein [Liquorilactobacillus satsumensis]|uniref:RNA-binding protein KhpA n=1 Tax=Liquorilactobacillus satsumensis DSM 16230 = JCM 12392 TaxID=1423801 RepID=A0A0R1V316_9LACO|nr:KH domain-containing protein [Liquorilactobacillus satsumensis]KRL99902.1 hypothetical protein FD50_GL002438 [Liquorilactobacillus satsumensis DSM 16230 = JCM 12392]MCC7665607.1 KH domain-containing protein [Liquorilactobacillus satsumensis]MCP9311819.1 KH domain-containing protein [Liquorilactobacillus satsumensis]MCP9328381.1 KH domain-containing protein [Liquorilactobacillus satsumensis]MCP9357992.1 KH domain-containing protein [Liquorilactobacillus satsumensis]